MRRIAQCDDEIHARCFRTFELIPRLTPQAGHVVAKNPQPIDHFRKGGCGGLRPSGIAAEASAADLFK